MNKSFLFFNFDLIVIHGNKYFLIGITIHAIILALYYFSFVNAYIYVILDRLTEVKA